MPKIIAMFQARDIVRIDNHKIALLGTAHYEDGTTEEVQMHCTIDDIYPLPNAA